MVLLIDNYDSFVYNLARYVSELGYNKMVKRNDSISIADIERLNPSHIIISPGPCTPNEAGISLSLIEKFAASIPILGICLGHQAIGQVFGAKVVRAKKPMHGKSSSVMHDGSLLFQNVPDPLTVARYHSLVVSPDNFPQDLMIHAYSEDEEIMAISHKNYSVYGLQFHPESVLTEMGHELLRNFLQIDPCK